ncbi:hypothetical protein RB595_002660 [Gaeumannomyces hyphopodioides]
MISFPAFADLPLELREQVWRDALPVKPGRPTLFPYVEGSWVRGSFSPDDQWYNELDPGTSQFTTPSASDIAVKTPLLDVNREARHVAIAWARKRGYTVKRRGGDGSDSDTTTTTTTMTCANHNVDIPGPLVITRPVDPSHDAIYLPTAEVGDNFVKAPWSLWTVTADDDGGGGGFQFDSPLTAVALPRALFNSDNDGLFCELDMSQSRLRLLYVILDPQPDVGSGSWELRDNTIYGPGSFLWDQARRVFVYPEPELSRAGEDMYRAVHGVAEMLSTEEDFRTVLRVPEDFEIRFAHAVKRW